MFFYHRSAGHLACCICASALFFSAGAQRLLSEKYPATASQGVSSRGEAVLLVRQTEGFAARRLQGIRTVKVSPNGKIVVVHQDGVAALDPELVPENFLRGWNISPEEVKRIQEQAREEQMSRLQVRISALRDTLPWMWQPPPTLGKDFNSRNAQSFAFHSLPWTKEDEVALRALGENSSTSSRFNPEHLPWWDVADLSHLKNAPGISAALRMDSRFDVANLPETTGGFENQQTDNWLEEALPRAEGFEVWRDVWSEFPLVDIGELFARPEEYRDRMVRVRGRLGNVNWGRGLEFFDVSDGVRNFRVVFTSLIQAAAIEKGLQDRMQALRSLPSDFTRDVTVVGEVGVQQGGRVFLDLIDFTF